MTEPIRVGILGHGSAGSKHAQLMQKSNNFDLVSVADPNPEALPSDHLFGVRVFDDYRVLIDEAHNDSLDAVVLALPTTMHVDAAELITQAELDMLAEKPMGVTANDARKIGRFAQEQGTKLMAGLTGRYHPEFVEARNAMDRIGDVISYSEVIHIGTRTNPLVYLEEQFGRGVGLTQGVHSFDRVRFFSGKNIISTDPVHIGNSNKGQPLDDFVVATVYLKGTTRADISLAWTPDKEQFDYTFLANGTKGTLEVNGFQNAWLKLRDGEDELLFEHDKEATFADRHLPGFRAEHDAFAMLIRSGDHQFLHVNNCVAAQAAIDEMYRKWDERSLS